ncbi:hypothetical protein FIBSPDRAFT_862350, partial [Athelia psychrophila]
MAESIAGEEEDDVYMRDMRIMAERQLCCELRERVRKCVCYQAHSVRAVTAPRPASRRASSRFAITMRATRRGCDRIRLHNCMCTARGAAQAAAKGKERSRRRRNK